MLTLIVVIDMAVESVGVGVGTVHTDVILALAKTKSSVV